MNNFSSKLFYQAILFDNDFYHVQLCAYPETHRPVDIHPSKPIVKSKT